MGVRAWGGCGSKASPDWVVLVIVIVLVLGTLEMRPSPPARMAESGPTYCGFDHEHEHDHEHEWFVGRAFGRGLVADRKRP